MTDGRDLERRLATIGWAVFFLWSGVAWLADVGWGIALLGVGIITLGGEAARRYFVSRVSGFWLAVGFTFALSGLLLSTHSRFALGPILCLLAGLALLASLLQRRRHPPH